VKPLKKEKKRKILEICSGIEKISIYPFHSHEPDSINVFLYKFLKIYYYRAKKNSRHLYYWPIYLKTKNYENRLQGPIRAFASFPVETMYNRSRNKECHINL
jgi:hypothetical protein